MSYDGIVSDGMMALCQMVVILVVTLLRVHGVASGCVLTGDSWSESDDSSHLSSELRRKRKSTDIQTAWSV